MPRGATRRGKIRPRRGARRGRVGGPRCGVESVSLAMRTRRWSASRRNAQGQAAALALALSAELRRCRSRLTTVSLLLGYAPGYLGRALRGRPALKVVDVFAVLRLLGASPRIFFHRHYPVLATAAPPGQASTGMLLEVMALLDRAAGPQRAAEPEVVAEQAARLLAEFLRRAGKSVAEAAAPLGLSAPAVAALLSGRGSLKAWHLFALLAVAGSSPGRFFSELLAAAVDQPPLPDGLGDGLGDELDDLLERTARAAAQAPPPAPPRPSRQKRAPRAR